MSEECQRCGEVEEDRRTLWMACFYDMDELDVPFEQSAIHGVYCKKTGMEKLDIINQEIPVYAEPEGEPRNHPFHTLRVCKRCRSDWMVSIETWFNNVSPEQESCGSGIFVRANGALREITEEEWATGQEKAGVEPSEPARFMEDT